MKHLLMSMICSVFLNVIISMSVASEEVRAPSACVTCKCHAEEYGGFKVDCSSRNLSTVPNNIPANVTFLTLSSNKIAELKVEDFLETPNLTELYVKSNMLTVLPPDLFARNKKLRNINLLGNKLRTIPGTLFHHTPQLSKLILSLNRLKELPSGLLQNTSSLERFSCSRNNLKEIPPDLFHSTPRILRIHLYENDIQHLPPELFSNSRGVVEIALSYNKIKELPKGILENTSTLRYFYMSNNLLEQLDPDLFTNTSRLDTAAFPYNNLQEIPPGLFHATPLIQIVNFSSNNIKSLHDSTFLKARELKILFLNNNSLTTLPESLFAFSKPLFHLHLSYNNLKSLPEKLFANTSQLENLHLEANFLTSLPSGLFPDAPELKSINLSSNSLAYIPENLLANTKKFQSLHVAANKLKSLPSNLFSTTPELDNISFSANLLKSIPDGFFNSTPNLTMISFASNMLESIPEGIFHLTPKLKAIDFVYNQLTELPRDLFAAVEELKYLQMSANTINVIEKDLFRTVVLTDEMDLSNNSLQSIPDGLFTSNKRSQLLKSLFLQRNKIRYIQKGAFKGLGELRLICLFDNQIEAIDSGAFSVASLKTIFLFKNNLQRITNISFSNSSLSEIHLYGNNITTITSNVTKGLLSQPTWFLSCELLRHLNASNMIVECINEKFAPQIRVDEVVSTRLKLEGFQCRKEPATKDYYQCKLCQPGTYSLGDNDCHPCPRGGFYQDTIGVKSFSSSGCKRCNDGTFVNFTGGALAEDCKVCPEGTNKNMTAGFRACFCKDGYARTDRFGPCYRCNQTGLNCSGLQDYQSIMKGYYWYWNFTGADNEEYRKFVNNLLEESENFDNYTFYSQQIPRVHRCLRPDSCNTNQTGLAPVRGTCSKGYTGWLCDKCYRGYFSLLQKCIKCPSTLILLLETFLTTVLSVTICYLVWTQYAKHKKRNSDERNLLDIIVSRFKISLGFYQVLGEFFSSIKDVRWIGMFDFMGEIFSYIRLNVLRIFFRPQCFDESLYINPKVEFVIALIIIFALTVIPFLFYHTMKAYLKFTHGSLNIQSKVKLLKAKIATISLVLLFVTYPPICTAIFQVYHRACVEFCEDWGNQSCRIVLRSDFELECTDLGVYRVFAYLATATYTLAFPVAVYCLLRKYCAPKITAIPVDSGTGSDDAAPLLSIECDEMNIPIGLKFLCENYKPQFWYWEIVELTRKVTQTALLTLLGWEDKLTVLLTIGVSVLFLTLHARYRPMKSVLEQRLQMFSLSVILINVLVAAMAMTVPDQYEQRLAIIILLLNISVIVLLIIEAVLGAIVQMKRLQFYRSIYHPRRFQQRILNDRENVDEE